MFLSQLMVAFRAHQVAEPVPILLDCFAGVMVKLQPLMDSLVLHRILGKVVQVGWPLP